MELVLHTRLFSVNRVTEDFSGESAILFCVSGLKLEGVRLSEVGDKSVISA